MFPEVPSCWVFQHIMECFDLATRRTRISFANDLAVVVVVKYPEDVKLSYALRSHFKVHKPSTLAETPISLSPILCSSKVFKTQLAITSDKSDAPFKKPPLNCIQLSRNDSTSSIILMNTWLWTVQIFFKLDRSPINIIFLIIKISFPSGPL